MEKLFLTEKRVYRAGAGDRRMSRTGTLRGLPFTRHGSRRPPAEDARITHTRAPSPHRLARASTAALQWRSVR